MTANQKKPTAFALLCENIAIFVARWRDLSAFQGARLSEIEDRLAALDGGHDAAQAKRAAIVAANAKRAAIGQDALGLRLASDGKSIEWCSAATMGRPKQ